MAQLHNLAPHYWNKPETANCSIVIPVPRRPSRRSSAPSASPETESAQRITLRLHTQYLSAKSLLLRGLLSGKAPISLLQNLCASRRPTPSTPLRIPRSRLPRLLPSPPSHPVLFLPVPDPSSIQPLFHWMYFGNTDHIENALDEGKIQWEGLARNVEYLALHTDIKVFLGRWYRTWHLPARCSPDCTPCPADEGDESDLSDCDDSNSLVGPYSDNDDDDDDDGTESDEELECDRGRTRDIKPLIRLCGQFRLCTT